MRLQISRDFASSYFPSYCTQVAYSFNHFQRYHRKYTIHVQFQLILCELSELYEIS